MDTVHAGQAARVLFPAYGQRNLPQIFGRLRSVSADRLTDERTGEPYFLAKVEVEPAELARIAPQIELSPGMPTDVMILTGERTLVGLSGPALRRIDHQELPRELMPRRRWPALAAPQDAEADPSPAYRRPDVGKAASHLRPVKPPRRTMISSARSNGWLRRPIGVARPSITRN